jgi:serine/threonine protein kinase
MAPEILDGSGYDEGCDWWSFGVILYEMLYGYPPFCSSSRHTTKLKILHWKQTLKFPDRSDVSREARDLIQKLLCGKEERIAKERNKDGKENTKPIMDHPFFKGLNWADLHNAPPPFVPQLQNPTDTSYFDELSEHSSSASSSAHVVTNEEDKKLLDLRKELAFVGFTFRGYHSSYRQRQRQRYLKEMDSEEKGKAPSNEKE